MPNFDVCMESESSEKSSNLILKSCGKKELQKFILNNDGKIYLEGNKNLCLTITQVLICLDTKKQMLKYVL